MPINVSIKKMPDKIARALRARAARNRRSIQRELLMIVEEAVLPRKKGILDVFEEIRKSGLRTPAEATRFIRKDRDGSHPR